jgi:hypothetical protein
LKRFIVLLTLLSVIAILSACSSKSSLELTDKEVEIIHDKERLFSMTLQAGEKAGQEVTPVTLYYSFSLKNEGSKKVGDEVENFNVKIEPNEKLLAVSKEVMGFNIFSPEEYIDKGVGVGTGHSFTGILEPNTEGQYIFEYYLGVNEKTEEFFPAPSKEQLNKLKENAFEATLIVLVGNEELTRFDLSR